MSGEWSFVRNVEHLQFEGRSLYVRVEFDKGVTRMCCKA